MATPGLLGVHYSRYTLDLIVSSQNPARHRNVHASGRCNHPGCKNIMLCHNAPTLSRLNTPSHLSRNKAGTLVTCGVWGAGRAVFCLCPLRPALRPALRSAHNCLLPPATYLESNRPCSMWGTRCEESLHAGVVDVLEGTWQQHRGELLRLRQRVLLLGRRRLRLAIAVALSLRFFGQRRTTVPLLASGPTRRPLCALHRARRLFKQTTHGASRENGKHAPLHAYCARAWYHRR